MTQQNAAMVEETTAAARSLASEAQGLRQLVTRFQLSGQAPYREAAPAKPARAKTRTAPASVGNLALAAEADDWSDF
jgi:methyl-accepting chemotaxis protein